MNTISEAEKYYRCPACSMLHHKKCTSERSNRSRSQPPNWKCDSCLTGEVLDDKSSRKRTIDTVTPSDASVSPPGKTMAIGSSVPLAVPRPKEPLTDSIVSDDHSIQPDGITLNFQPSGSVPTSILHDLPEPSLNIEALPFVPMPMNPSPPPPPDPVFFSGSVPAALTTMNSTGTLSKPQSRPSDITAPAPVSPKPAPSTAAEPPSHAPPPVDALPKARKTTSKALKAKQTLATSPEDFQKETLKVERDFARLKVRELDQELKSKSDSLEILTARCRILEEERNKQAAASLSSSSLSSSSVSSPTVPTNPTIGSSDSRHSASPIESLVNLEVLSH